jgi:hypothetical protein
MSVAEPLLNDSCCTAAHSTIVIYQWVYMQQYGCTHKKGKCYILRATGHWVTDLFQFKLKLKLIYDQRSVSLYVLIPGSHLEPMVFPTYFR